MGWLLATIAGSGLSRAEVGRSEAKNLILNPTLHGMVLTTNNVPITNAIVTIKRVLAGRGAVYVSDAPDCNRQAKTMADGTFAFKGMAEDAKILVLTLHTERDWHSGGDTAFTDQQGEFAFRPTENIIACDFSLEADGYVSRSFSEMPPGLGTNIYQLSQGARLTGRLLKDGQSVPDAGIGIYDVKGGDFLNNFSAVTDGTGRFTFSGLQAHEEFCLFGIMRSLRELGAFPCSGKAQVYLRLRTVQCSLAVTTFSPPILLVIFLTHVKLAC